MSRKIRLKHWICDVEGNVQLIYEDGATLHIRRTDFYKNSKKILTASKQEMEKDYNEPVAKEANITAQELMDYLSYLAAMACTNTSTPAGCICFNTDQIRSAYIDILKNREGYQTYRSVMFDKNGVCHEPA